MGKWCKTAIPLAPPTLRTRQTLAHQIPRVNLQHSKPAVKVHLDDSRDARVRARWNVLLANYNKFKLLRAQEVYLRDFPRQSQ